MSAVTSPTSPNPTINITSSPSSANSSNTPVPNKFNLDKSCVVCREATLEGEITIGANTIIHPKAQLLARKGPIIIGANNIIEEHVVIESTDVFGVKIGDWNLFEVGSSISSASIGNGNILEIRSKLPAGSPLTNGCTIGQTICMPISSVPPPANSIYYGTNQQRRYKADAERLNAEELKPKIDILKDILPKTHKLIES